MMEQEIQVINEPNTKERILSFVHALLLPFVAYVLITAMMGVFENNGYPLLMMIGVAVLFVFTLLFGLFAGYRPNVQAIAAMIFGLLQGAYVWINGISFLAFFIGYQLPAFSYAYFVLALFGNQNRTIRGGLLVLDLVKATFVYPFLSFATVFNSCSSRLSLSNSCKYFLLIFSKYSILPSFAFISCSLLLSSFSMLLISLLMISLLNSFCFLSNSSNLF